LKTAPKDISAPAYYTGGIEPMQFIRSHELGYNEGCIIKYIVRWQKKHENKQEQLKDLLKAREYLNFLIDWEMEND
jgi:hypothetical protein